MTNRSAESDNSVMTEIKETTGPLPAASRDFVLRWGEMGDRWGMNRSVAQVHALLYVAERPLTGVAKQLEVGPLRLLYDTPTGVPAEPALAPSSLCSAHWVSPDWPAIRAIALGVEGPIVVWRKLSNRTKCFAHFHRNGMVSQSR